MRGKLRGLCHKGPDEMTGKGTVSKAKVYLRPSGKSSEERALDLAIWRVFGMLAKAAAVKL